MLTPKQEKFCQCIIKDMSQTDAYREAFDTLKMKEETIWSNASRLIKNSKVRRAKKRKKGSPAQNNVPNATDESLSLGVNRIQENQNVKAFDIKNIEFTEEDLKVIKDKLTQSLNKEAVFFINSFLRK